MHLFVEEYNFNLAVPSTYICKILRGGMLLQYGLNLSKDQAHSRISQRGGGLFGKLDPTVNELDPNFY